MKKTSTLQNNCRKKPDQKKNIIKKAAGIAGKLLLTVFLICVISGCIIIGTLVFYVAKVDNPGTIDLNSVKLDYTSIVYANDPKTGKAVEIQRLYKDENRIWVSLSSIPKNMQNAFICTEDQRFYEHKGVDIQRTVAAFANVFIHIYSTKQGASTITQQLVKTAGGINSSTYPGKIKQIIGALNLEKKYSKEQILEAYLNTINLGGTNYGIQTAANMYFGKDVSQLDLAECACIAAIPKEPTLYNPLLHPDKNAGRRKIVLQNMLQQKKITQEQYTQALNEKLTFKTQSASAKKVSSVQSYFVDQVITDITNDLMTQKGYTKKYAQSLIYSQGLQIYTTMNPDVQKIMEEVYTDSGTFPKFSGTVQPQSAMVILNYQGQVVGIVGGRGQKTANMVLDRATMSKRQPGSSIKPLAVYAPALEYNQITWSTKLPNQPYTTIEGKPWPLNDDRTYGSPETITTGLARSINTIAVNTCALLDPTGRRSYDFLTQKLGFTTLVKAKKVGGKIYSDIGIYIAIGALTDGVTPLEMAGGYEIFGNGGKFYKPYTYTKVLDSKGNVILQNNPAPVKAISDDTSFVMNQLLQQNVIRSDGTGHYAMTGMRGMPVGGKTGTTSDNHDRWFVGITPYYVGACWFGYDQGKNLPINQNWSLIAWNKVMQKVSGTQKIISFPASSSAVQKSYCLSSGGLATPNCPSTATGWYRSSNIPSSCTEHPLNPVAPPSSSALLPSSSSSDVSSVSGQTTPVQTTQ